MDDLVKTARRAKGSDLLPKISFGVMDAETLILRMADRIEALEQERDEAVAAAYGLAARAADAERDDIRSYDGGSGVIGAIAAATAIRALIPNDATAALAARDRRMKAEGMRLAWEILKPMLNAETVRIGDNETRVVRSFPPTTLCQAILAAASEMEKADD